jgi:hypothetical protein
MNGLAIVSVLWGILIIISRTPFLIAPVATINTYRKISSTNTRIRMMGVVMIVLSLFTILFAQKSAEAIADVYLLFGWIAALVSVFMLLIFPIIIKEILEFSLKLFSRSVTARLIMIIPTAIGIFLIYMGIAVL